MFAREVHRIGSQTIGAVSADGYRISVDAERFAHEASPSATVLSGERASVPDFEVWLGSDDAVVRVVVQPRSVDGDPKDTEVAGWAVDYLPGNPVAFTEPSDVTALDALDPSALVAPAAAGCALPS